MGRIVQTEDTRGGKPRIDGTRVTVEDVIGELRSGKGFLDTMVGYDLSMEELEGAVLYHLRHDIDRVQNSGGDE